MTHIILGLTMLIAVILLAVLLALLPMAIPLTVIAMILGFLLAWAVLWMGTLVSAITNPRLGEGEKICWVLTILILNIFGALLYLIFAQSRNGGKLTA